jgi:Bacterial regulatory helix-turn-helix protein, lysR family
MSIRFDLTDLRLFVHVAEAGSITHGAARANMTLASASERIRAMEDALSAPLLERKRRGFSSLQREECSCITRGSSRSSWSKCAASWPISAKA